jgi:hypothetical protein
MSRTDTAVPVISASPDRLLAALTDPDELAGPGRERPRVRVLFAHPGPRSRETLGLGGEQ